MNKKQKFKIPKIDPECLLEFWKCTGLCLLQIQTFELILENYLVYSQKLEPDLARSEAERIFDKASKLTLGNIFNEVKQKEELPNEISSRVDKFISERNWLVHRCRKENEKDLYKENSYQNLIQRIKRLTNESLLLGKYFEELSENVIISKGFVTKEKWDQTTQKILNSWMEE